MEEDEVISNRKRDTGYLEKRAVAVIKSDALTAFTVHQFQVAVLRVTRQGHLDVDRVSPVCDVEMEPGLV